MEDPDGREIIGSGVKGTGKGGADGSFISVEEPKATGMHCSFCGVSEALIYRSCGGG